MEFSTIYNKLISLSKDVLELSLPEDHELLATILKTRGNEQEKMKNYFDRVLDLENIPEKIKIKEKLKILADFDTKIITKINDSKKNLNNNNLVLNTNEIVVKKFNFLKKDSSNIFDTKI